MEITARESAPYSCISYGGCVNGYRSEGETVTITEYRCETHTCAQGNEECGTTTTEYGNGVTTTRKAAAAPNGLKTTHTM